MSRHNVRGKILLVSWCLCVLVTRGAYALNLDKLKTLFLNQDYKGAILEGEKILAAKGSSSELDELYLILGLSYMKDANYLRASDIFEIIINEYKNGPFKEDAKLGLADTYFLRKDFDKAETLYKEIISANPHTKLEAEVYYRLSQVAFEKGDAGQGKEYLDKLKQEFPSSPQLSLDKALSSLSDVPSSNLYYTVQVGSFSNITNANNLVQRLTQKGYSAYIEEAASGGKTSYRVRVGKSQKRQDIVDLENRLSKEGYPTKIFP